MMSALDDYLLRSEPLHTVRCAIRYPSVACSCDADKMAEAARDELAALRAENAAMHATIDRCGENIAAIEQAAALLPLDPLKPISPRSRGISTAGKSALRRICVSLARQRGYLTGELQRRDAEIARLRADLLKARHITTTLDCRYTLGDVADISGSHCPLDKPCERCRNEMEIARLRACGIEVRQ